MGGWLLTRDGGIRLNRRDAIEVFRRSLLPRGNCCCCAHGHDAKHVSSLLPRGVENKFAPARLRVQAFDQRVNHSMLARLLVHSKATQSKAKQSKAKQSSSGFGLRSFHNQVPRMQPLRIPRLKTDCLSEVEYVRRQP